MLFTLDEQTSKLVSGNKIKYTTIQLSQIVKILDYFEEIDFLNIHRTGNRLIDANIGKLRIDWNLTSLERG